MIESNSDPTPTHMTKHRFRSLNYKLLLWLLITGMAGLAGGGFISMVMVDRYLENTFRDDADRVATFVEAVALQPILTFDFAQMSDLANAVTGLPSVTRLAIADQNDAECFKTLSEGDQTVLKDILMRLVEKGRITATPID